jgi:hypothetical protein
MTPDEVTMLMVKPSRSTGQAILLNQESFSLDWQISVSANAGSLDLSFEASSGTVAPLDPLDHGSGFALLRMMVEPALTASSMSAYSCTALLQVRETSGAEWLGENEAALRFSVHVLADAGAANTAPYTSAPAAVDAGGDIYVTVYPYDRADLPISHSLASQGVYAYFAQPGEDEVECAMSMNPMGDGFTYETTACKAPNEVRGGTATLSVVLKSGPNDDTVLQREVAVACPDIMGATGEDGLCECPAGYYRNPGATTCDACGAGYYSGAAGLEAAELCEECPERGRGMSTTALANSTALGDCVCADTFVMTDAAARTCQCPAGKFLSAGEGPDAASSCEACPADTASEQVNTRGECDSCAALTGDSERHTNGTAGSDSADACVCYDPSMLLDAGGGRCECPAGYYFVGGEPAGPDTASYGACVQCGVGEYVARASGRAHTSGGGARVNRCCAHSAAGSPFGAQVRRG